MLNVSTPSPESTTVSSGPVSTRASEHRLAAQEAWTMKFDVAADSSLTITPPPGPSYGDPPPSSFVRA